MPFWASEGERTLNKISYMEIERKHGNIMKSCYDLTLVNAEAKEDIKELVKTAESLYFDQVRRLVDRVVNGGYKFLFIGGPSAGGKTTSAKLIAKQLNAGYKIKAKTISLDDFFKNIETANILEDGSYDLENFERVDAVRFDRFISEVFANGKSLAPEFDFVTGHRKAKEKTITLAQNEILIVEGTHVLNPKLAHKNLAKDAIYRVYVCSNSNFQIDDEVVIQAKELRKIRRLIRNFLLRGEKIEHTLDSWKNVLEGEEKYIKPFKNTADYLLDTVHIYEPLLYANYLPDLLKQIKDKKYRAEVDDMLNIFSKCEKVDISVIPRSSLLWEFFGKPRKII